MREGIFRQSLGGLEGFLGGLDYLVGRAVELDHGFSCVLECAGVDYGVAANLALLVSGSRQSLCLGHDLFVVIKDSVVSGCLKRSGTLDLLLDTQGVVFVHLVDDEIAYGDVRVELVELLVFFLRGLYCGLSCCLRGVDALGHSLRCIYRGFSRRFLGVGALWHSLRCLYCSFSRRLLGFSRRLLGVGALGHGLCLIYAILLYVSVLSVEFFVSCSETGYLFFPELFLLGSSCGQSLGLVYVVLRGHKGSVLIEKVGLVDYIDCLNDTLVAENTVAVVLEHRANLEHLDYAALLCLGQIVEDIWDEVERRADYCGDDEHVEHILSERSDFEHVVVVLKAEHLIDDREHHAGEHSDKRADYADGAEHSVDALAGEILLIVTHIGVYARGVDY